MADEEKEKKNFSAGWIVILSILILLIVAFVLDRKFIFWNRENRIKIKICKSDLQALAEALYIYARNNVDYPNDYQGLKALVQKPEEYAPGKKTVMKNWKGPYLKAKKYSFIDPWGNEYNYRYNGIDHWNIVDIWSWGKDGKKGGTGADEDIYYINENAADSN